MKLAIGIVFIPCATGQNESDRCFFADKKSKKYLPFFQNISTFTANTENNQLLRSFFNG